MTDANKVATAYAKALRRLEDKERAMVRTFNAWDKLRRAVRRYERRLDTLQLSGQGSDLPPFNDPILENSDHA